MKVFWAVLLVLIVASVAYLTLGKGRSSSAGGEGPTPVAIGTRASDQPVATRGFGEPVPATPRRDNDEAAFFPVPEQPAAPTPAPDVVAERAPAPAATPAEKPVPEPTAANPVEPAAPTAAPEKVPAAAPAPAPAPAAAPAPAPAPAPATPAPTAAGEASAGVTFAGDAKVVTQDDGTVLVDDKYPLKGDGTKAKPYEITWDYLVSAQEDYQPRLGKKKLPGRMKLISGKYVKITGFVAFPIMATEPTEMLAMLNQWDGCCIGIPPTPYDAVEVKLSEPASNEQRLTTFGTVEGKLTVEPYLVRDWLVSLYAIDEATMSRAQ